MFKIMVRLKAQKQLVFGNRNIIDYVFFLLYVLYAVFVYSCGYM